MRDRGVVDWTELPAVLAAPDRRMATRRAWGELLDRLGRSRRPPHEVIVFGFCKLGWKPRDVVCELGDKPLRALAARLERECTFGEAFAVQPFAPLHARLRRPLVDSIRDPRTRRLYADLLARTAGTTTLRDYFPAASERQAEAAVVHWWHSVRRSLVAETLRIGRGDLFEWVQTYAA